MFAGAAASTSTSLTACWKFLLRARGCVSGLSAGAMWEPAYPTPSARPHCISDGSVGDELATSTQIHRRDRQSAAEPEQFRHSRDIGRLRPRQEVDVEARGRRVDWTDVRQHEEVRGGVGE